MTTDPEELGDWGRHHGALGLSHNNGIWDPKIGDIREGIEIHAAHHLASAGCVAIEGYEQAKRAILHMIAETGEAFLHIWPGLASITPSATTPGAEFVAFDDTASDVEETPHRKERHRADHQSMKHSNHHRVHYVSHHYRHHHRYG